MTRPVSNIRLSQAARIASHVVFGIPSVIITINFKIWLAKINAQKNKRGSHSHALYLVRVFMHMCGWVGMNNRRQWVAAYLEQPRVDGRVRGQPLQRVWYKRGQ